MATVEKNYPQIADEIYAAARNLSVLVEKAKVTRTNDGYSDEVDSLIEQLDAAHEGIGLLIGNFKYAMLPEGGEPTLVEAMVKEPTPSESKD